ncbi:MAG: amidohydrolase family protein [Planctomycetota bacterium]
MGLRRMICADWIFPPGEPAIEQGALLFEGDRLLAKGSLKTIEAQAPDTEPLRLIGRALIPGLINCHTHLELATLGRIAADHGFTGWVRDLLAVKEALADTVIIEGAEKAARAMKASGTAYVADIASSFLTIEPLKNAGLSATVFREFLGLEPEALDAFEDAKPRFDLDGMEGVRVLPACHAPFSTSPGLFRAVDEWARAHQARTSVHLAESEEETELLLHGRGAFLKLIQDRGIDPRFAPESGATPVTYLDRIGFLGAHTLAVHLVQATADDLAIIRKSRARPCLCPSSNLHLTGKLPRIQAMIDMGLAPCLGTDSPVSGESLNLFKEMEILLDEGISPEEVLAMGTRNGANALALPNGFGSFEVGTPPAVCSLPITGDSERTPLENGLRAGARGEAEWVLPPGPGRACRPGSDKRKEGAG